MARSPASRIELDVPIPPVRPTPLYITVLLTELASAPRGASVYLSRAYLDDLFVGLHHEWLMVRSDFIGFRIWKIAEPKSEA